MDAVTFKLAELVLFFVFFGIWIAYSIWNARLTPEEKAELARRRGG